MKGMLSDTKRVYMSLRDGCGMVSTQSVSYLSLLFSVEGVVCEGKLRYFMFFGHWKRSQRMIFESYEKSGVELSIGNLLAELFQLSKLWSVECFKVKCFVLRIIFALFGKIAKLKKSRNQLKLGYLGK
jgi:hypothetical protein